jgi:hypothetical protein
VKVPTSKLYFVTSAPGEWLQHSVNALPGVPSVAVPMLYTSYGVLAVTWVAAKPVMLAKDADPPQAAVSAINRILFDAARLTPVSCSEHGFVNVHSVVPTNAPFIVNCPTAYE